MSCELPQELGSPVGDLLCQAEDPAWGFLLEKPDSPTKFPLGPSQVGRMLNRQGIGLTQVTSGHKWDKDSYPLGNLVSAWGHPT